MKKLLILISLFLVACSPKPSPIAYGEDACAFCRMTIVDKQHAAETVSSKGKAYKFDAIECMIQYTKQQTDTEFVMYLVNDYSQAGSLIDATASTFLISKNIPSPMGAFLSAFADAQQAQKWQKEKSGEIYNWQELQAVLQQ